MWGLVCCALGQYTGAGHGQLPPVELPSSHSEGEGWIYADVQLMLLTYSVWKEDYMYGILIRIFYYVRSSGCAWLRPITASVFLLRGSACMG